MIKTLRITTIIAAILAVGLLAFPVVYGYRDAEQEQIEKFLSSPGAVEMFNKAKGVKTVKGPDQIPPLVKQAMNFGLYLNPPAPVSKPETKPRPTTVARSQVVTPEPPKSTAKFTLIGTSYYQSRPELSLAYIDEPGKGLHWVRQGVKVGHLLIEQVKDGSIVVKDSEKSVTLVAVRPPKKSLLKGESSSKSIPVSSADITSVLPAQGIARQTPESAEQRPSAAVSGRQAPQPSFEEMALMEKLVAEVGASMQADAESGEIDPQQSAEKSKALLEKFISELEAMRVPAEEARRLDRLGRELNSAQSDPNRPPNSKIPRSRIPPRPPR
jgi:hypothetical protein